MQIYLMLQRNLNGTFTLSHDETWLKVSFIDE